MSSVGSKAAVTLLEMLVVIAIIAVIASVSFPALTSGLAGIRLVSAAGSVASFLTSVINRVDRREQAAEIVISPVKNDIEIFTAASSEKPGEKLEMPAGIVLEGDETRRFFLYPGGAFPRVTVTLRSEKGGRRSVSIDPVTAVPKITRPAAETR